MIITQLHSQLLTEVPFLNAGRGSGDFRREFLPVHHGTVDNLPDDLDALLVTADLQGRETFESAGGGPPRLLGEVLPRVLVDSVLADLKIAAARVGVLLAGDFYTVPALDRRGGTGDVTAVWQAFGAEFAWVAGVAGNHDLFGTAAERPRWRHPLHFLDGDVADLSGLTVAGISGIVGNPRKPWRRDEERLLQTLEDVVSLCPDILLMHDGPDAPDPAARGSTRIRQVLESADPTLVVRGHVHWNQPLSQLSNGTQVLNVDSRAVILTADQPAT